MNRICRHALLVLLVLPLGGALAGGDAPEPRQRAYAPTAPVRLDYVLPEQVATGEVLVLPLTVVTPVQEGAVIVEVVSAVGVEVLEGAVTRIELASAEAPPTLSLKLLAMAADSRYLVLQATLDLPGGMLSRNLRIELPAGP
jgi:hypothetical protein